ncbi:hypothetical protein MVLG_05163 [Microbotryum lychnidis-dioicae p1A1 Lamole]|uniref:Uncharacterized protein n=1 Tax=Microbotryum lychnidis-dioicae (strain p1A1 Lamole / MvSl-1064) TaxID=683840 RepID=U5HDE8_USTV1|nr:hypothetical protein MVLG_05163 [Microbotryum lychnidis-dioicae p1A1 Lamole]|eukprot:KDE04371.1 hypothetical protein MVLG_05163 [Microbotryum lychnidis-dioicae p1A1 Lamole]
MPVIQDEIIYRPLNKPQEGVNGYQGFQPGKVETLPKGFTGKGWDGLNSRTLASDILVEHDVEIVVRDGARLYADIYRPPGSDEKVPVIIGWSPYGKKYSATDMLPVCTWKCGVIPSDLSGFEKFEGLDPAIWCPKGYAIASIDQRGAGCSDGNVQMIGSKDAEDGYDVIEWLSKREWCNGKVGMAGNSYLAISQYFIAALQPPSLAAIAPWDGLSDLYREQFVRGGIFNLSNFALIASLIIRGNGGIEDFAANYRRYPKATSEFWSDKRVDMTKINVPCYLAGSDVSSLHTMGTLRAWTEIGSKDKWLRWGGYQEWFDLYSEPHNQEELLGFFDLYLKGKKNGWAEATPRVRMTILNFGDKDPVENIVVDNWPLPQTQYTKLFIRDGGKLALTTPSAKSSLSYNSEVVGSNAEKMRARK